MIPQQMPPMISVFREDVSCCPETDASKVAASAGDTGRVRNKKVHGIKKSAPIAERTPLKVNGST